MSARRVGVGLTPMETRREVVLHLADRAEQLGYEAFFVAEGWGHDAGVLLAEIATRTSRITLGTGIINVWGRTPASIAMLATSLAAVSGDRFVLGLGAGSPPLAEGLHDVAFTNPVQRLGEVTRQVRRLLSGDRLEPTTERRMRPLKLAVVPQEPIPINLAALGPSAVQLAGELADGWYPFLLPLSGLEASTRLLQQGLARGAPDRTRPTIAPCIPTAVADDPVTAHEVASWWVSFYLVSMGPLYRATLRRLGHGPAVEEVLAANPTARTYEVPESARGLLDDLTLWGDVAHARSTLDRWYAAGAEVPTLTLPPGRPVEELDHMLEALRPT
ncbi:LLM class flavin-dependent oxidoreductase [Nocardioides iriomotensis]|uniref:LLM class flavin-dependent oxidoreductase n=1 Tax=Nocardioides iriomotensis TaxID=715784 RepID=A0A4Q5J6N9_9ACTN|nr:LLM class flavin-dependent oxidoreductase [Nocardioides iriomotensis]RYU14322.1 LLM class flavin-dependent oxidoreductase [Nocardioides iriomotensis]